MTKRECKPNFKTPKTTTTMGTIRQGIVRRNVPGGGTKLYATGVHYSRIDDNGLILYMLQNSQVGRASAVAAVEAFKAAFTTFLMNGHTMVVPALGTFSLTCNSKTSLITHTPPAEPINTDAKKQQLADFRRDVQNAIQNIRVRFTPQTLMQLAAKSVRFQPIIVED